MKKTTLLVFTLSFIFAATSCTSTKNNEINEIQDSYESETGLKTSEKTKKKSKFDISSLLKFGNAGDYISFDNADIYTKTAFGSLKKQQADVVIYTKDGKIGFGSNYMSAYYYFLFDTSSLNKLEETYNSYLRDFETKKLNRKEKNKFKKYGRIKVDLKWGTIKTSTPNNGSGYAYIGYDFIDKSPYFHLSIQPVYNLYSEITDGASRDSLQLKYYFTKAQMKDLLEKLSDETVTAYLKEEENFDSTVTSDDY